MVTLTPLQFLAWLNLLREIRVMKTQESQEQRAHQDVEEDDAKEKNRGRQVDRPGDSW